MSVDQNKKIVQRFYELNNAGDIESALALFSDELIWTNIGSTVFSGTQSGKNNVMENLIGPLFSRLEAGIHGTVRQLIAEGDFVVAQVEGRARTTDGQDYNNTYCMVYRLQDGTIMEVTEYMDTELITRAFGS